MPISTFEAIRSRAPEAAADADGGALKEWLKARARAEGFDVVRVARPRLPAGTAKRLGAFLAAGHYGDMAWMARNAERRGDPARLWPEAKSAVVLGLNYGPGRDPLAALAHPRRGAISVYAQGDDYHDLVKTKLKAVARDLAARAGSDVKVFVDTAPLMEKPLAEAAGAGWQGKHTNLVSRGLGSWLFLGEILTSAELAPDAPETDHCGSCRACLDVCPTQAFPAPYRIDARRCISYLTIEHKGHIAREFRKPMGNRIYGCDDCLAVCPWNKFARQGREAKLKARPELARAPLDELAALDEARFRRLFSKSPVKRTGRNRFLRNVLIAIGNSGAPELAPAARARLGDESALVRAMAVWALGELCPREEAAALARTHLPGERDRQVAAEWRALLPRNRRQG